MKPEKGANIQERKKSRAMRWFLVILVTIFVIIIVLAAKKYDEAGAISDVSGTESELEELEKWQEGDISYNGTRYSYNTAIKTYLFMGIDKTGIAEEVKEGISGGQSDAMFLLAADAKKKKLSVIAINRNTMTKIDVYDEEGAYVGQYELQICLQHGYGDGMRISCLRAVNAVSRLFYQLPVNGYFSLQMEGVPMLNDAVGGVTVEVMEDIENKTLGVSLHAGETVTLDGNAAYAYIRSRDIDEFGSASRRLERQQQYLLGLIPKVKQAASGGESAVMKIYDAISDYAVTNIDFAQMAAEWKDYTFDAAGLYSVPGELVMGTQFEEYYVDDTALYEMILEIFYEPVQDSVD